MAPVVGPEVAMVATGELGVRVEGPAAFIDLVVADAELVDLEFEAIVEAGWDGDGVRPRGERRGDDGRRDPADVGGPGRDREGRDLLVDRGVPPHERGPP